MSLDIISRKGHPPLVVGEKKIMDRVVGLYVMTGSATLRLLDAQDEFFEIPLERQTAENVATESGVVFSAVGEDDQIAWSVRGKINRDLTSATPIVGPELTAFSEKLVQGGDFNLETVDYKKLRALLKAETI